MSFYDDETSVETSEPREGVWIRHGLVEYRLAFSVKDVVIAGQVYSATPGKRSEMGVASAGKLHEISFTLSVDHPFSKRYMQMGMPPYEIKVTFYRYQRSSQDVEQFWDGLVVSSSIEEHLITFTVQSYLALALNRTVSSYRVSKVCQHVLFDDNCKVVEASYSMTTLVADVQGRVVTVASVGGNNNSHFQYGKLVQDSTGEPMTIYDHTGNELTLQYPIPGLQIGDSVTISAGCPHSVGACGTKFGNVPNFGGIPQLPKKNPHLPDGFGVYSSEPELP